MNVTNYYTHRKYLRDEYDSLVPCEACIYGASKFLVECNERDQTMKFYKDFKIDSLVFEAKYYSVIPSSKRRPNN